MRVVFIGTGVIGLPVLRWLADSPQHQLIAVVTQPDRPAGRSQQIQPPPVKAATAEARIPIFQPERIRREEAVQQIRALEPDVIVVMAYGQILPRAVLEIPRVACLNLHASLLPRHRGAAPIQAAIAEGDRETGLTVMYMDEGVDTGDILLKSTITVGPEETGGSLHDRLAQMAPAALEEAFRLLQAGSAPRVPQDHALATYSPKLNREHGQIDWCETAEMIERKIRACDPWPGAFTVLRDALGRQRKLKIFRAQVSTAGSRLRPGELRVTQDAKLLVGTGDALLSLIDVQLEGKRRLTGEAFSRGNQWVATATAVIMRSAG